jgi:hypothetical protein
MPQYLGMHVLLDEHLIQTAELGSTQLKQGITNVGIVFFKCYKARSQLSLSTYALYTGIGRCCLLGRTLSNA